MKPTIRFAVAPGLVFVFAALCSAANYDVTDLGTLGGGYSSGFGISANGQVTGQSTVDASRYAVGHPFLYDGTMHDLGSFGAESGGQSINASGQVVGWSYYDPRSPAAFLYDNTHGMVDLNTLIDPSSGWDLRWAYGINDAGQITGAGLIGGETHAFLLTPVVPEPSSIGLLLTGALALGMVFSSWPCKRTLTWGPKPKIRQTCRFVLLAGAIHLARSDLALLRKR